MGIPSIVRPGAIQLAANQILVGDANGNGADVAASGDISIVSSGAVTIGADSVARSNLVEDALASYEILFHRDCRVWDAMSTVLPATASADDMALITGTLGTDTPSLQGVDFGGTSTDEMCAFVFALPAEYNSGGTITLRCRAAMLTTISDGTATLDAEAYLYAGDGAGTSDLCATAAASINSLTPANIDFVITPTGLVPGDQLLVRLAFGGSDTGNLGVMIPEVTRVQMLVDIKG